MTGRLAMVSRWMAAAFLLWAGMGSAAHAEKRVALVIGNSAYRTVPALPNPVADAKLMSDTLSSLGFFVVGGGARLDLDKAGFDDALREFGKELVGADAALFYYAGHGVETHGLNYLAPVDAHPLEEADIFTQMVGMSGILDQLEKSGARINLVLLDACRDNAFSGQGVHSTTGGLAQMPAPVGTLISFATQPRSRLAGRRRRSQPLHQSAGRCDAAARLRPVQDLQRSRACRGENNPRPANPMGVLVADLG